MGHDSPRRAVARRLAALLCCSMAVSFVQAQDNVAGKLDTLIAKLPVKAATERDGIVAQMLDLGEPGIRGLCDRIKNRPEPLDGKVCAALHGLVHAAGTPGKEATRRMVAGVFGEILEGDATVAAKTLLLNELRTIGRAESVAAVGACLTVTELCEPAAQTLIAVGSAEAAAALRAAVPKLNGRSRVTVIYALGRIHDRMAVPLLTKEAGSNDDASRHAAFFALAEIGDPSAETTLHKAALSDDDGDCERARHSLLRFAIRLDENGNRTKAAEVCRALLKAPAPNDAGIGPGAFYELMGFLEEKEAAREIMVALGHENAKVRTAALRSVLERPGSDVTRQLAKALVTVPSEFRPPIAELLRERGDPAALNSIVRALDDPDADVRVTAISAAGALGKRDIAPRLIAFFDKTPGEAAAARSALTAMGDGKLSVALIGQLPKASPAGQSGLLTVLAARDAGSHRELFLKYAESGGREPRRAALKILGSFDDGRVVAELMRMLSAADSASDRKTVEQALLSAAGTLSPKSHKTVSQQLVGRYGEGSDPVRCALIGALKAMNDGYPEGLDYVRGAWENGSAAVRGVALRALAEWPTAEPMQNLLNVASQAEDTVDHVLALRGSIRMAGQAGGAQAVAALKAAMEVARRPEEKRQALGAVSRMADARGLEIAALCLNDDALEAEAAAAVLKIAGRLGGAPTTVYVAFDKRAASRPTWLQDWQDANMGLKTTDTTFRLYSKTLAAPVVTLGGNRAPGASSHYIVLLQNGGGQTSPITPATTKALQGIPDNALRKKVLGLVANAKSADGPEGDFGIARRATKAGCRVIAKGLKKGAKVYVDRDYTFDVIPPELIGASYVMMANGDKNRNDAELLVLSKGNASLPAPPKKKGTAKKAGAATTRKPAASRAKAGEPVRVVIGGKLVTEYHYADADRPYFYPVIAPTGDNVTRHWPMNGSNKDEQQDHKHHRSLWFTHGDVNGHDFWSEGRGPKIVQTSMTVDSTDDRSIIFTQNEWRAKDGTVVCTDARRHTVSKAGDSLLIDFAVTIKASHGDVVLGDTKEGSMAFRVAPTLRAKGKVAQGNMINSEGGSGKAIWGKRATWCDYYGPLKGKTVGIALLDHPTNPRHPTTWHARDYGLCAANPFGLSYFEKKPKGAGRMTIRNGDTRTFRYRTVVHSGTPREAGIEALFRDYAKVPASRAIFNGTDFTGWVVPENNTWWRVHDGMISVKSGPRKKGSVLWTEKKYRNFVVETDFRFGEGTIDSGVFLRTEKQQVQLGISGSLKRDMTGSVYVPGRGYPLEAKGIKELLKPRDWNALKVEVIGSVYTVTLNGREVLVFEAENAVEEGPIGLQLHAGKVMAIDFRNVKVAELQH